MKSRTLTIVFPGLFRIRNGEKMQNAIDTLGSVRDQVSEAIDEIGEIWE